MKFFILSSSCECATLGATNYAIFDNETLAKKSGFFRIFKISSKKFNSENIDEKNYWWIILYPFPSIHAKLSYLTFSSLWRHSHKKFELNLSYTTQKDIIFKSIHHSDGRKTHQNRVFCYFLCKILFYYEFFQLYYTLANNSNLILCREVIRVMGA